MLQQPLLANDHPAQQFFPDRQLAITLPAFGVLGLITAVSLFILKVKSASKKKTK